MTGGLDGKLAIVTGASRGIGLAVTDRLSKAGAGVVRLARSLDRTKPSSEGCDIPCDLRDDDAVARAVEIICELGSPDLLVNCAGSFMLAPLEETSAVDFRAQLEANLIAPFQLTRRVVAAMDGSGRVINIGSIADHVALPGNAAYGAAKFGLRGLHEVLRAEFIGRGIGFSLVSPGPTDTSLWDSLDPDNNEGLPSRAAMLRAEDVADAVLWIATRPTHVDVDVIRLGPVL